MPPSKADGKPLHLVVPLPNEQPPTFDEFKDRSVTDWKRIRGAIEHENSLTNQRVTWVLQAQGLLMAAFGLLFTSGVKENGLNEEQQFALLLLEGIIALVGILTCTLLALGVKAAHDQHKILEMWWKTKYEKTPEVHPPICGEEPGRGTFHYYHLPTLFIPTWVGLICATQWKLIAAQSEKLI